MSSSPSPSCDPSLTQTYAESCGSSPFDWGAWLARALYEAPSDEEWGEAGRRSQSWVTCACGNQCAIIPRTDKGCPIDSLLESLGGLSGFHGAIIGRNAEEALQYLRLIEVQSSYLIQKEMKKRSRGI